VSEASKIVNVELRQSRTVWKALRLLVQWGLAEGPQVRQHYRSTSQTFRRGASDETFGINLKLIRGLEAETRTVAARAFSKFDLLASFGPATFVFLQVT